MCGDRDILDGLDGFKGGSSSSDWSAFFEVALERSLADFGVLDTKVDPAARTNG
jgi:hypothetical protein